ncbi:oxygen-dependent tRNA uridine(34) hydroxylase TrhO [Legionella sp. CNM-4043-24]|uniref:oxygen-dependent tRNA uridine(34) hydroxylase TrhO n=1 Tax=Legionella sp. CNM-4043-24 TaxID=3421646 RepID=UPI00403AD848
MNTYVIAAFYRFTPISDYEDLKQPLLTLMKEQNIKGTIILASEGVNGTFCGERAAVEALYAFMRAIPGLADLFFRETFDSVNPFEKAKVKLRKEIVTMGVASIDPLAQTGTHVDPEEWNTLISDPDVVLVDTRNDYEFKLGTFEGAINPLTDNFRDFPEYVKTQLLDKKDKKIAMFCTGGIRCEKSTAYLMQLGFDKVYQLNGGILNYMASIPQEKSRWQGSCFVFDERVALDHSLKSLEKGSIDTEWKNKNKIHAAGKETL